MAAGHGFQEHGCQFNPGATAMIDWFFATLKSYPEIAIFLALGFG